tara:strand:- start:888 stop:1670 length:783 start_codon:yes stop_codon:yes gene_type:complete
MPFSDNVSGIIDDIELQRTYDKAILKHRFLDEITYYEKKRDETRKFYNVFRFIVTTGSILLPAVLSMGQMDPAKLPKNFDMITYWCSWTISLMVTGSNGFLQLFSLDKNYFSYSMVVEQLKTEGWQFFGLSGKYEDYPDHQSAYKTFSKSVESIKRKQIDQEFSNGKGENKKKKFDFKGEMQKFAQEQNADLKMNNIVEAKLPIDTIKDVIETVKKVDDLKDVIEYVPQKDANESVPKVDSILNENVVHELVNKVVEKKD